MTLIFQLLLFVVVSENSEVLATDGSKRNLTQEDTAHDPLPNSHPIHNETFVMTTTHPAEALQSHDGSHHLFSSAEPSVGTVDNDLEKLAFDNCANTSSSISITGEPSNLTNDSWQSHLHNVYIEKTMNESGVPNFNFSKRFKRWWFFRRRCCDSYMSGRGVVRSPNYPFGYNHNMHYTWRLDASPGYPNIFLEILHFSIENRYDILEIHNEAGYRKCYSGNVEATYYSLASPVFLTFTTDDSVFWSGFEIAFVSVSDSIVIEGHHCNSFGTGSGIIRSPGFPNNYPNAMACFGRLDAQYGYDGIFLRILHFSTHYRDKLRVFSHGRMVLEFSGASRGSFLVRSPAITTFTTDESIATSGYEIAFSSVQLHYGRPEYECHEWRSGSGIIRSRNFPQNYYTNQVCSWELSASSADDAISLQFLHFSTIHCCHYLRISDYSGYVTSISGFTEPRLLTFRTPVFLSFITTNTYGTGSSSGFEIAYKSIRLSSINSGNECGSRIIGSGIIQSPAYPGNYGDNIVCLWRLEALSNDGIIFLKILDFSTESYCDHVRISNQDGLQHSMSGQLQAQDITIKSPAFVTFTTDFGATSSGFQMIFSTVSQPYYRTGQKCGGALTGRGTIHSPEYPRNYQNDISCLWKITSIPQSGRIFMQILDFSTEPGYDFLTILGTSHRISGIALEKCLTLTSPVYVNFTTDGSVQSKGFAIAFSSVELTNITAAGIGCGTSVKGSGIIRSLAYSDNFRNFASCLWRLEAEIGYGSLFLQILHFSGRSLYDQMFIFNDTGLQIHFSGEVNARFVMVSSPAIIAFATDDSESAMRFEVVFSTTRSSILGARNQCGGSLTGSGIIRSPGFPGSYPNYISCVWSLEAQSENNVILLQVLHLYTQVCCDHVRVLTAAGLQTNISQVPEPRFMTFATPAFLTFTTDGSGTSTGFEISFTSVPSATTSSGDECGKTLIGSGIISSPAYPGSYQNNLACVWRLEAPYVNGVIFLQIIYFETEPGFDYLRIANTTSIYISLSGIVQPQTITLGSTALISFTSDSSVTSTGFVITFSSFQSETNVTGTECGGFLSDSGIIRSPGYPNDYKNYIACLWSLEATASDDLIFLQILHFETEKCCDYLQISNNTGHKTSFSGATGPLFMTLKSSATIQFKTDGSVTATGFYIAFSSVASASSNTDDDCSRTLTNSGVIRSPGYPNTYPSNVGCVWRLEAASGSSDIFLQILHFDTESCCAHLRIFNSSGILATISGVAEPQNLTLGSPTFITFTAENSANFTGFEIVFNSVHPIANQEDVYAECVSTVYSPNVIAWPPLHAQQSAEINCSWSLLSKRSENYSIQLTFDNLLMRSCCDYLEISDGSGFQYIFSGSLDSLEVTSLHLQSSSMVSLISSNVSNQSQSEFRIFLEDVPGRVNGICHTGNWTVQGTQCFKAMSSSAGMTWYGARSQCRSLGGFLVEIKNSDEHRNVEDYLRIHVPSSDSVWIGLKRGASEEDPWLWDTGTPPAYTNWTTGQPTSISSNETCAALNVGSWLGWSTFDCNQLKAPLCMLRRDTE